MGSTDFLISGSIWRDEMLSVASKVAPGVAPVSAAATEAVAPERELHEPRLGRDLSGLTAHLVTGETPLQYAETKLAGLISAPSLHGPVNDSLNDYVRAILGMQHDAGKIDPGLRPYLDQLSRNASRDGAQAITLDSFKLLWVLYMVDPKPVYGKQIDFMNWLNGHLGPGTVRDDLIPEDYFKMVCSPGVFRDGVSFDFKWHTQGVLSWSRNAMATLWPEMLGVTLQDPGNRT
jgi:hypothetical protein